MIIATRSQVDYDPLQNSLDNSIGASEDKKLVREEEAHDADINVIVDKWGPAALLGRPKPTWGLTVDYTVTLQQAYDSAREVSTAYERLPQHVRDRYSPEEFFGRIRDGEEIDLSEPKKEPDPTPPAPEPEK